MDASDYAAADAALPLPGLDAPARGATDLELAARRSLAVLHEAGLLQESHAMLCQLVLDLSRAVGLGTASGRASAAAMAAAQLREAWLMLPAMDPGTGLNDEWDKLAQDLREAADTERARQRQQAQP